MRFNLTICSKVSLLQRVVFFGFSVILWAWFYQFSHFSVVFSSGDSARNEVNVHTSRGTRRRDSEKCLICRAFWHAMSRWSKLTNQLVWVEFLSLKVDGKNFVFGQKEVKEIKAFRVEWEWCQASWLQVARCVLDSENLSTFLCRPVQVWWARVCVHHKKESEVQNKKAFWSWWTQKRIHC